MEEAAVASRSRTRRRWPRVVLALMGAYLASWWVFGRARLWTMGVESLPLPIERRGIALDLPVDYEPDDGLPAELSERRRVAREQATKLGSRRFVPCRSLVEHVPLTHPAWDPIRES